MKHLTKFLSNIKSLKFINLKKFYSKPINTDLITEELNNLDTSENIIDNFKEFHKLEASDVMINRKDIIATSINTSFKELTQLFVLEGHSRIPVYKSSLDDIEGFIHVKDVFKLNVRNNENIDIDKLIRDIIFVPQSIKLQELLSKMKKDQIHIAIVLDEHAGTTGLVTIENIVEELVGEINDEHDLNESNHQIIKQNNEYFIDGLTEVNDVEKALDVDLSEFQLIGNYNTIAGLLLTKLGFIPKANYKFLLKPQLEVEILEATPRSVKQIKILKL